MSLLDFTTAELYGMLDRADEFGVSLIGGDTCSSKAGLVISVTVMGEQLPGKIIRRKGARAGDAVFVTGTLGDSALALEMLKKGERGGAAAERHLDPSPRVHEGIALAAAGIPTAMIDISDGLLIDLSRLCDESNAGVRLFMKQVPLSRQMKRAASFLGLIPDALAMSGGEDYELLFTSPPGKKVDAFCIGEITDSDRIIIGRDGTARPLSPEGYQHWH